MPLAGHTATPGGEGQALLWLRVIGLCGVPHATTAGSDPPVPAFERPELTGFLAVCGVRLLSPKNRRTPTGRVGIPAIGRPERGKREGMGESTSCQVRVFTIARAFTWATA